MRRKRIMIIGPSRAGKTTLANHLNDESKPIRRTQDLIYGKNAMDVPGSYIENTGMYKHLIAISQDASHVLLLVDQENPTEVYSPGFSRVFRCPAYGVITKSDKKPENRELCIRQLEKIGVAEPYFHIGLEMEEELKRLKAFLGLHAE